MIALLIEIPDNSVFCLLAMLTVKTGFRDDKNLSGKAANVFLISP